MTHAGDGYDGLRSAAANSAAANSAAANSAAANSAAALPVATASRPADGGDGAVPADQPARGRRAWVRHILLLLAFEVAGVVLTWPLATFLPSGTVPATEDTGGYVWDLWWVAHHILSPGQLFYTQGIAAPVGMHLGFSTIMPLAGVLLAPVTLTAGPAVSLILLGVITPGLLCYAMFRLARLWLNAPGAIAAGAFFGLSATLSWRDWFHINVALGTVFLPLAIEAAIRFRRTMSVRAGAWLGVVLGASVMINAQTFVIGLIIAVLITLTWVLRLLIRDAREMLRRTPALLAAVGGMLVAGGFQFLAMLQQMMAGGASPPANVMADSWTKFGASLPSMFGPSPRLADFGLGSLSASYNFNFPLEGIPTYGIVLSVIAVAGIVVGWRRRTTWWFALTWFTGSVLALGTSLIISTAPCTFDPLRQGQVLPTAGCRQLLPLARQVASIKVYQSGLPTRYAPITVSDLMPYSWLVRIQTFAGLREADRFIFLGLIGAALLAGITVQWLSQRKAGRPLIAAITVAGLLEAGWAGTGTATVPSSIPRVAQALSAAPPNSIVVDVPYGLRGGLPLLGARFVPWELMVATADGHPRAISFTAWVSGRTIATVRRHSFYNQLMRYQALGGARYYQLTPGQIARIRADYQKMKVGAVVEWIGGMPERPGGKLTWPGYLTSTGHFDYENVAGFLTEIGMKRVSVICIAGPRTGCPLPDQAWIWKPAS